MVMIMLVRGFKLSVSAFDDFLMANGRPTLGGGYQPHPNEEEYIDEVFKENGIDCEVKVFVPQVPGYNTSHQLFVCCDWIPVLAVKEIEDLFQKPVPPAFERLRDLLGAKSEIRRYIIYNDNAWWYTPQEAIEHRKPPVKCGICEAVFDYWEGRMKHRYDEHGIREEWNPLPEC